jgi:hypothetical protein
MPTMGHVVAAVNISHRNRGSRVYWTAWTADCLSLAPNYNMCSYPSASLMDISSLRILLFSTCYFFKCSRNGRTLRPDLTRDVRVCWTIWSGRSAINVVLCSFGFVLMVSHYHHWRVECYVDIEGQCHRSVPICLQIEDSFPSSVCMMDWPSSATSSSSGNRSAVCVRQARNNTQRRNLTSEAAPLMLSSFPPPRSYGSLLTYYHFIRRGSFTGNNKVLLAKRYKSCYGVLSAINRSKLTMKVCIRTSSVHRKEVTFFFRCVAL